jgi:hypothetical protein
VFCRPKIAIGVFIQLYSVAYLSDIISEAAQLKNVVMKKIIIIFICSFLVLGCKKNPFDFRTKFLGTYHFSVHEKYYSSGSGIKDTTYYFDGEINYGDNENDINIPFLNSTLKANVYEDGTIEGYWDNNGKGEFVSTKKVKYKYGAQSPGGGTTRIITGERK